MLGQWDLLESVMYRLASSLRSSKHFMGVDFEELESNLLGVDSQVGVAPQISKFEECGSVWDGLLLLDSNIREVAKTGEIVQDTIVVAVNTINCQISQSLEQHQKPSTIKTEKMVDEVQMALNGIGEYIWTLGLEQERLPEMVLLGQGNMESAPLEELNTLKAQMKVLEA